MQENEHLKAQLKNSTNCQCCLTEHRTWRKHYETYLDNLIKQTLNELKLHEAIRGEYFKLESYLNGLKITANKNHAFCPSNSWTFDDKKQIVNNSYDLDDLGEKHNDTHSFQILSHLKELLSQQQRYQLNLIDELSHLAFNFKINTDSIPNNNNNNSTNSNTFISKVQVNFVNDYENLNVNRTQLHLILNHSENRNIHSGKCLLLDTLNLNLYLESLIQGFRIR